MADDETIRMIEDSASALVPPDGTLTRIRAARFKPPVADGEAWATIRDMGWLAMRVPEDAGGLGLGLPEAVALAAIFGRGLVPEPLNAAAFALRLTGDGADGPLTVAAWQAGGLDPRAGVTVQGGRLTGRKVAVEGAVEAAAFAVTTPDGVALVPRDAAGLTIEPHPTHDGGFLADLTFHDIAVDLLPCPQMETALDEATVLHAAYLRGLSERALEITLDYLRIRKQFGVAIGSFQALQHRATEMKIQLELARAAIDAAAERPSARTVSSARARAGGLARLVAREAIQMHGAIGYTDEADIGLYARRAVVACGLYGTEAQHRARYMTLRENAA